MGSKHSVSFFAELKCGSYEPTGIFRYFSTMNFTLGDNKRVLQPCKVGLGRVEVQNEKPVVCADKSSSYNRHCFHAFLGI